MNLIVRACRAAIVGACIASAGLAQAQPPDAFAVTRRLAAAGAPQLVLDRVERLQPGALTAPGWGDWEALRCRALSALRRHAAVTARLAAVPADRQSAIPAACLAAGAQAALAERRYAEARRHAARVLWGSAPASTEAISLRRLVIDSYVGERRGDEAYRAMLRYQQDHQPLPREVAGSFVAALLDLRMEREALTWLTHLDDSQPARLLLRMRAGLLTRDAAVSQARAALVKAGDPAYWGVIAEAAGDADLVLQVAAREHLLNVPDGSTPARDAARALWDAYLSGALDIANRARLLVGDDTAWADHAGRRLGNEPTVARMLFAYLAQHARSAATRHNAQLQIAHAYETERLELTALRLFEAIFPDVDVLDTQVRYRLGSMAERRGEPRAALRYWGDLPPSPDADAGAWAVRLARQRWRAEGGDPGAEALARQYAARQSLSRGAVLEASAYVAELDEAGRPAAARVLLESLLPHAQPADRRAMLVALGRANEAAGDLPLAAEAYLHSALLADGEPDEAALQARMRAAVALARSGYRQDAHAQFEWIAAHAKNASQRETAQGELKKLQP